MYPESDFFIKISIWMHIAIPDILETRNDF